MGKRVCKQGHDHERRLTVRGRTRPRSFCHPTPLLEPHRRRLQQQQRHCRRQEHSWSFPCSCPPPTSWSCHPVPRYHNRRSPNSFHESPSPRHESEILLRHPARRGESNMWLGLREITAVAGDPGATAVDANLLASRVTESTCLTDRVTMSTGRIKTQPGYIRVTISGRIQTQSGHI